MEQQHSPNKKFPIKQPPLKIKLEKHLWSLYQSIQKPNQEKIPKLKHDKRSEAIPKENSMIDLI